MTKLPISLMIIAHNEAARLPRCLDSVAPWVSEIVAVINDCTDDTRAVLESYGARVYDHAWEGFGAAKNRALSYCQQPWVLSLDADEQCAPELANEIHSFVMNDEAEYAAASCPRLTRFLGKWIRHGDWYPDRVLRLFRRERAKFVGGPVHERVEIAGKVWRMHADLLHYSFPNLDDPVRKLPGYAQGFFEISQAKGKHWSALEALSRSLWRFLRCYVIKRGFMDGFPGFYIAAYQCFATLHKYSKLYEFEHRGLTR